MVDRPRSEYREFPVSPELAPWLACTWMQVIGRGDADYLQRVLPDGCADLLWIDDRAARVVGPATIAVVEVLAPGSSIMGVRLRPGAVAAALDVSALELRDRQSTIETLWGHAARELDERSRDLAGAAGLAGRAVANDLGSRCPKSSSRVAAPTLGSARYGPQDLHSHRARRAARGVSRLSRSGRRPACRCDKATCRVSGRMTVQGRELTLHGIDILRFEGGLLVERWGQFETPPSP
jgi:hypothetical protein